MKQKDIGKMIKLISDKLQTLADASLKEHDLTLSQVRVLEFVHLQGEKTTQKEIENHLAVSHPTVVGIISRLNKAGFLESWFDPENKRNKIVATTKKARDMGEAMYATIYETEKNLIKGMSDEDILTLTSMLDKLYNNLVEKE